MKEAYKGKVRVIESGFNLLADMPEACFRTASSVTECCRDKLRFFDLAEA